MNLAGQPISREPHYALLCVTCESCGTVNAVNTYPSFGRGIDRLKNVIAAWWLLLIAVLCIGGGFAVSGIFFGATADIASGAAWRFESQYQSWMSAQSTSGGGGALQRQDTDNLQAWWDSKSLSEHIESVGGLHSILTTEFFVFMLTGLGMAIGFGWLLSLSALGVRRRGRLILGTLLLTVPMLVYVILYLVMEMREPGYYDVIRRPLTYMISLPAYGIAMVLAIGGTFVGILFGRAWARRLALAFLPPRLQGAVAFFWRVDDLDPPPFSSKEHYGGTPRNA